MGGNYMLNVNNISFSYLKNQTNVIDDVSFSLKEGQVNILLGPNGIGKSTVLKCLNRILKVNSGTIEIDGKDINSFKARELAKIVAYVEQSPHVENMSVYETIMLGRTPYITFAPTKKDKEIVEEVIKEIGLDELGARNISSLSGGEKQKVMIALALASDSKILLLDEPTANLDIKNSLMVMNLIKSLAKKKNLTVLVSMHDISLAFNYGDYFLFMGEKNVKYALTKKEISEDIMKEIYDVDFKINEDGTISYKGEIQ